MEKIRFENITKIFGDVVANNNISFSIEKGEVISILGENGSGKTTLLNVLDGIYQQDEGRIYIDGNEVKMEVTVGQKVIIRDYAGTTVKIDGEEVIIVRQEDILAVVE